MVPPRKSKAAGPPAGEAIRVVPLHHPKPVRSVDELVAAQRAQTQAADPFAGPPPPAPAPPHLTYNGGPLLTNVQVFTIFWGARWGTSPAAETLTGKLHDFFSAIVTSPLLAQLGEYGVPGQAIGGGAVAGSTTITAQAPAKSVTDSAIQAALHQWIQAQTVPPPGHNLLYFLYLDPGVISVMGGSKSCQSYCGYHSNDGSTYYAVMPYPSCDGCLGGLAAFDALTATSSHELCEAVTDPVPGTGWYDQAHGEIGDICAWNFKQVAGYTVQREWSNRLGRCV
jgi:hypothetical protein